jgi:hypothetical protein
MMNLILQLISLRFDLDKALKSITSTACAVVLHSVLLALGVNCGLCVVLAAMVVTQEVARGDTLVRAVAPKAVTEHQGVCLDTDHPAVTYLGTESTLNMQGRHHFQPSAI